MITDRYFTDEEFEKKELIKKFYILLISVPIFIFLMWYASYSTYSEYEVKPIYLFIYNCLKYSPLLIVLLLLIHKIKNGVYERIEYSTGLFSMFSLIISFILLFLSVLFDFIGKNRDLIIDTFFITSFTLFILYFIVYYIRYMKRAKKGREKYINELKKYHFIIDPESRKVENNYFRIKNKKLEGKLDILAIFIKILTPTITTITIFIGYKYIQNGENDPSIFIVALGGVIGSAYFGSLLALIIVAIVNLNQIEKQIGRKLYPGLYPETIARKKAEVKENEEYWEKRLEEEENKKSKLEYLHKQENINWKKYLK